MENQTLEELMAEAAERIAVKKAAAEEATKQAELAKKGTLDMSALGELFSQFEQRITNSIDAKLEARDEETVSKGRNSNRRSEVGGSAEITRDGNPLMYIAKKARSGESLDPTDKELAWGIMKSVLSNGLTEEVEESNQF